MAPPRQEICLVGATRFDLDNLAVLLRRCGAAPVVCGDWMQFQARLDGGATQKAVFVEIALATRDLAERVSEAIGAIPLFGFARGEPAVDAHWLVDLGLRELLRLPGDEAALREMLAGLEGPLAVAGLSMGGYVAQQMLSAPRRSLHGLALISTSGRPESPEASATREKTLAAMQSDFPKVVEGILKWSTHSVTPASADRLRQMMLDLGLAVATAHTRAIQGRSDQRAVLQALRLPVRILCGDQDRVTPPELAKELSGWIPHAQLEIIQDCGHMLPAERPEAVVQALRALMA